MSDGMMSEVEVGRVAAEALKLCQFTCIRADAVSVKASLEWTMQDMLLRMEARLASTHWEEPGGRLRVPANWVEALKDRFVPARLRRGPLAVRYTEHVVKVTHYHVCPHLPMSGIGQDWAHLDFLRQAQEHGRRVR